RVSLCGSHWRRMDRARQRRARLLSRTTWLRDPREGRRASDIKSHLHQSPRIRTACSLSLRRWSRSTDSLNCLQQHRFSALVCPPRQSRGEAKKESDARLSHARDLTRGSQPLPRTSRPARSGCRGHALRRTHGITAIFDRAALTRAVGAALGNTEWSAAYSREITEGAAVLVGKKLIRSTDEQCIAAISNRSGEPLAAFEGSLLHGDAHA